MNQLVIEGTSGDDVLYFEILYPSRDPDYTKWSLELFYDAIVFFYKEQFNADPDGFRLVNEPTFYPYQKGDVIY